MSRSLFSRRVSVNSKFQGGALNSEELALSVGPRSMWSRTWKQVVWKKRQGLFEHVPSKIHGTVQDI